jgi:16S rRNA G966 N2-methylase RsmD
MRYFATFISGTQDVIGNRLAKFPSASLKVEELKDGLVVFESSLKPEQLSELRFLNNVYQLLADDAKVTDLPVPALPAGSTVTVRAREGSQPTIIPPELTNKIIAAGLVNTAHNPQFEFLLWRRTDGRLLWGMALPRAGFKTRHLEAGELRPELAHILGLVAGLDAKDIVLDPFAGYGAIARECLQGFHCEEVIAMEHNEHLIPHLKSIPHVVALHGDAGSLPHIPTRGVDRVITDPPWGEYEGKTSDELWHLYRGALLQIHRVLRAKGAVVMLTAAPFLPDLAAESSFDIVKQYPILVNGRKAVIYKLRKLGN